MHFSLCYMCTRPHQLFSFNSYRVKIKALCLCFIRDLWCSQLNSLNLGLWCTEVKWPKHEFVCSKGKKRYISLCVQIYMLAISRKTYLCLKKDLLYTVTMGKRKMSKSPDILYIRYLAFLSRTVNLCMNRLSENDLLPARVAWKNSQNFMMPALDLIW